MKWISRIIGMMVLLFATQAWAAWTIDVSIDSYGANGSMRVKINAVSDGSDPAAFSLSTSSLNSYLSPSQMASLRGKYLIGVETDPGVEPDSTWAVVVSSGNGSTILSLSGLSTTASQLHDPTAGLGFLYKMMDNIQTDINDIGSAADSVTIYYTFE